MAAAVKRTHVLGACGVALALTMVLAAIAGVAPYAAKSAGPADSLPTSTVWTTAKKNGSWTMYRNDAPFVVKGACYSPTEIGGDINFVDADIATTMWGDYFWDTTKTPNGEPLYNWYALWGYGELSPPYVARNDLKTMAGLGVNSIRTYFMQSRLYKNDTNDQTLPYTECPLRTHTQFLDEAHQNGLSVLVGIALPANLMKMDLYMEWKAARPSNLDWWVNVIRETAEQVGSHPAVMGFTIMNELDDEPNAFPYENVPVPAGQGTMPKALPADAKTNFWYARAIEYAKIVKKAAPMKLVGWAIHDAPVFVAWSSKTKPFSSPNLDPLLKPDEVYMQQLSAVFDFYGVNSYQTQSLVTVMGAADMVGDQMSYADPSIADIVKPVLLTELGWSSTGRAVPSDPSSELIDNGKTQQNVADVIARVMPGAYTTYRSISVGAFWFEFADEWFKQGLPTVWNGADHTSPGFPNGYWDEESFGIFARRRAGGRSNSSNDWAGSGPTLPVDQLLPRMPIVNALKEIFRSN